MFQMKEEQKKKFLAITITVACLMAFLFLVIHSTFFSVLTYKAGEKEIDQVMYGNFPNESVRIKVRMTEFINGKKIGGYVVSGQEGYYYRLHSNPAWNELFETMAQVNITIYGEGMKNITIERAIYFEVIGVDFDDDGVVDLVLVENTTIPYPFADYYGEATTPVNFSDSFTIYATTNNTQRDDLGQHKGRRNHPLIVRYYTVIRITVGFYFSRTIVQSDWLRLNGTEWSEAYAKEYAQVDVEMSIALPLLLGGMIVLSFLTVMYLSMRKKSIIT